MFDTLLLKLPRDTEVTPEMAKNFLAGVSEVASRPGLIKHLLGQRPVPLALEIISFHQQIQFTITCGQAITEFVKTQLQSNYPLVVVETIADPLLNIAPVSVGRLSLATANYYPLSTAKDFRDLDPLASVLSVMAKAEADEVMMVQLALAKAGSNWQHHGQSAIDKGRPGEKPEQTKALPEQQLIRDKISFPGYYFTLLLAATHKSRLRELASAFQVFSRAGGNRLSLSVPLFSKRKLLHDLQGRRAVGKQVLNIDELATIWHLPGEKIKVTGIAWGSAILSEAPENLPLAEGKIEAEKATINFFAKTVFKNKDAVFGIKDADRCRHLWSIGKTGTGKSTLIANMAIDDFKKGRGVTVIDPHGDLSDILLDYIPSHRVNDVIYLNPADKDYTVTINPLEVASREERELVVSGIVAIFHKLYGYSWGPRLEYILRNCLLTLTEASDSTLGDVIKLLTDFKFRQKVVDTISDTVMKQYWLVEYAQMPERLRQEAIAPILNKVGQFVGSPLIRSVIGSPKSSVSIDAVINEGKILIANLSQGRLGEDNGALLGAMLITKFQLASMRRVNVPEEQRRDFYLYVDEFQNFATLSFVKILSEARKYRLNLMMANQYIAQIPEEIIKAILGNVGSLITFTVGASDAFLLKREFSEVFSESDLVNLENYQIAVKLMIDAHASRPFLAHTLPLPVSKNQNRDKVIRVSRERYSKKK